MSALEVAVVRRPSRRTHLADPITGEQVFTWCGIIVPAADAHGELLSLFGGATFRLKQDLTRTLNGNTCKHCTRIAYAILVIHASRNSGRPM